VVISGVTALLGLSTAMFTVSGLGIVGAIMAYRYVPRRANPSEQIMPTSENM
jgi:hypothetical protein